MRPLIFHNHHSLSIFQSTHLLRGATKTAQVILTRYCYFNPRTSCEVRPKSRPSRSCTVYFNPRTSCEVRLLHRALRENLSYFNPRTSCEVRRAYTWSFAKKYTFQSTHLLRGATFFYKFLTIPFDDFNPRTSCEVRLYFSGHRRRYVYFNPRTSCEVRQACTKYAAAMKLFQSTHLLRGVTHHGGAAAGGV